MNRQPIRVWPNETRILKCLSDFTSVQNLQLSVSTNAPSFTEDYEETREKSGTRRPKAFSRLSWRTENRGLECCLRSRSQSATLSFCWRTAFTIIFRLESLLMILGVEKQQFTLLKILRNMLHFSVVNINKICNYNISPYLFFEVKLNILYNFEVANRWTK